MRLRNRVFTPGVSALCACARRTYSRGKSVRLADLERTERHHEIMISLVCKRTHTVSTAL